MSRENQAMQRAFANSNNFAPVAGAAPQKGDVASLMPMATNPSFKSSIGVNVSKKYYRTLVDVGGLATKDNNEKVVFDDNDFNNAFNAVKVNATANTNVAGLPDALKTPIPFTLFGKADYSSGYRKANQLTTVQGWTLSDVFNVTGESKPVTTLLGGTPVIINSPSVEKNNANQGDVVFQYIYSAVDSSAGEWTRYELFICEVIISCNENAYATILNSTSSDRFIINAIRYKVPSLNDVDQFNHSISTVRLSLFGRTRDDKIDPQIFFSAQQFQSAQIDMETILPVDKETFLTTYLDENVDSLKWTIFIASEKKLTA